MTGREREKETERQGDRESDRERERERKREKKTKTNGNWWCCEYVCVVVKTTYRRRILY